jgi:signal transduction histidine kinase
MYGERDDPYAVLVRLGQQLKESLASESVLPTIVETVAHALKLPFVAIALKQNEEYQIAAEFGLNPTKVNGRNKNEILPLVYQSELIGELILAPRTQEEAFIPAEKQLLAGIADQAALAAYTVRLMSDLKVSRQRLVNAREEERRQLRRELHDGLGSVLASLSFNLDAASNLLDRDPAVTGMLLKELKIQTQAAIKDVRRLAYNLRPPVLDELGLAASLREFIQKLNCPPDLHIEFNLPETLPVLPAAVEVAAYRISVEGINNIVNHSQARNGVISISILDSRSLAVEIKDDGRGLPKGWHAGVGVSAMRERTAELGGAFMIESYPDHGTCVGVMLPLSKE